MEIARLLTKPEGKTLEFKRDLSSTPGVLRTVSAFANTAGGTIVIGVDDEDHAVRGLADPLREEERLANLIHDGIRPQVVVEIEVVAFRKQSLLVVQVHPGPGRPYHIAKHGVEEGSYVRVGSTNRRAGPEMVDELRRANTGVSYDEQPLADLDSEAIDFRLASEQFAAVRRLRKGDLRSLGVTKRIAGRDVPTIGGVLLFGRDRLELFPDAVIQIARFEGTGRIDILDMQTIDATPVPAIDRALELAVQYTRRRFEIRGSRRRSVGRVPESALREAIVNAVVHADYSQRGSQIGVAVYANRVEVESPGLLPFGMTIEDILSGHSKLRNRVLGRVFHELGLIEQWGTGVPRMIAACRRAGTAEPRFEEVGVHFRVVFPFEEVPAERPQARDSEILELLRDRGSLSTAEIAEAIGRTARTVRNRMKRLVDARAVVVLGSGKHDPMRRYQLATRR